MPPKATKSLQTIFADPETLTQLLDIGQSLVAARDLSSLLRKIVRAARSILKADVVVLYEYQADIDDVNIPPIWAGTLKVPRALRETSYGRPHKDSVVFKMLRRAKPVYASNAREDWLKRVGAKALGGGSSNSFIQREGIVSSAAICLTAHKDMVGVLFVNYRTYHSFSEEEKHIIELFATQAVTAVKNARLFRLEQDARQRAETLQGVAAIVNSTLALSELVDLILEQLQNIVAYDSASVQVIHGDQRDLVGGRGFVPDESELDTSPEDFRRSSHKRTDSTPHPHCVERCHGRLTLGNYTSH